jgi:hypothetical protein
LVVELLRIEDEDLDPDHPPELYAISTRPLPAPRSEPPSAHVALRGHGDQRPAGDSEHMTIAGKAGDEDPVIATWRSGGPDDLRPGGDDAGSPRELAPATLWWRLR